MIEISYVLDYLLFEFLDVVLGTQVDYNSVDSSDLIFDLDDFHLHKKDSHDSLELVCSGLVCCCGFEVVTFIPIKVLKFFNLVWTFLSKPLVNNTFLYNTIYNSHFIY